MKLRRSNYNAKHKSKVLGSYSYSVSYQNPSNFVHNSADATLHHSQNCSREKCAATKFDSQHQHDDALPAGRHETGSVGKNSVGLKNTPL